MYFIVHGVFMFLISFTQMILSVVLWTVMTAGGTRIKISLHSTTLLRCLMNLTHAKKFVEIPGRKIACKTVI